MHTRAPLRGRLMRSVTLAQGRIQQNVKGAERRGPWFGATSDLIMPRTTCAEVVLPCALLCACWRCRVLIAAGYEHEYSSTECSTIIPHTTVYITRDVVYHTPGAYHRGGDTLFEPENNEPIHHPGSVYHTLCGVMPQNQRDTPTISYRLPFTHQLRTGQKTTNFLSVVSVVNINLAYQPRQTRTQTSPYP